MHKFRYDCDYDLELVEEVCLSSLRLLRIGNGPSSQS